MGIPFFVYPFLIRGAQNRETLPQLFQLLEVLSFRYKLVNSRADIRSRLNELISCFNGDVAQLASDMSIKMNEAYYWGDDRVAEILNSNNMYNNPMIHYFLWEYEQELQCKGYLCGRVRIVKESIEHISPRTEDKDASSTGYEVGEDGLYAKEYQENYINKLGNLLLISQSHNSSIGNRPFKEKLASYMQNPLLQQQAQIKEFVSDLENPLWDHEAIDKRQHAMLEFAVKRWAFPC